MIFFKMFTTPSIPRRSPIQVLTGLYAAWLRWSDENRYFQRDMAVNNYSAYIFIIYSNNFDILPLSIFFKMFTTPSIPRRSPIQVLTGLYAAWLRWSDENRYFQRDMAVNNYFAYIFIIYSDNFDILPLSIIPDLGIVSTYIIYLIYLPGQ